MPLRLQASLDEFVSFFRRTLQYAFHDWIREMPKPKRFVAFAAVSFQGYGSAL
jgi:hypothetical protein